MPKILTQYSRRDGQLGFVNSDSNFQVLSTDARTATLVTIEIEHHYIHMGRAWSISGTATRAAGELVDYIFTTPNTQNLCHFRYTVTAEAEGTIGIYEAPTFSDGTPATALNRQREVNTASGLTIVSAPTVTGVGTLLEVAPFGAGRDAGDNSSLFEWVFAADESYLVRITSDAAGNEIFWEWFWYELETLG